MTCVRRVVLLVLIAVGLPLTATAAASASAAPLSVARAPGREVISVDGGFVADHDAAGDAGDPAVALPNGGAVVVITGPTGAPALVELEPDGTPDPSFTSDGLDTVLGNLDQFSVEQIVRQADGRLILVGNLPAPSNLQFPTIALVRLNADGTLDPSFGVGGLKALPLQAGCLGCVSVGLRPDGGYVVSATTGQQSPATATNIEAPPQTKWVVAGLTGWGAFDPNFGQGGIVTLAQNGGYGTDVAVLPDGDIVAAGAVYTSDLRYASQFTRLLPSGAPDPSFHGGTPEYLPSTANAGGLLAYPDGAVVFSVEHAIVRYTAAGLPDETFGTGGVVQIGNPDVAQTKQLLPAAGDGALVVIENDAEYAEGHDQVERIAADGAVDPTLGGSNGVSFEIPFGGGSSDFLLSEPRRPIGSLDQDTFGGSVLQRPDGSYLFLGDAVVSQPTGEGEGRSIDEFAAAALTASFAPDPSFGGPVTRLRAKLALVRQRASTARRRHGIRVMLKVSAAGLARVVIKASGRVVAENLLPVFGVGSSTLPVELTTFGDKWLHNHPRSRLTATVRARDLLTNTTADTTAGALR